MIIRFRGFAGYNRNLPTIFLMNALHGTFIMQKQRVSSLNMHRGQ
jgi:hypothetical protein